MTANIASLSANVDPVFLPLLLITPLPPVPLLSSCCLPSLLFSFLSSPTLPLLFSTWVPWHIWKREHFKDHFVPGTDTWNFIFQALSVLSYSFSPDSLSLSLLQSFLLTGIVSFVLSSKGNVWFFASICLPVIMSPFKYILMQYFLKFS